MSFSNHAHFGCSQIVPHSWRHAEENIVLCQNIHAKTWTVIEQNRPKSHLILLRDSNVKASDESGELRVQAFSAH